MNRRVFVALSLSSWMPAKPAAGFEATVLETFQMDGRSIAILVHHRDEATRELFARWLRTNPASKARIRDAAGTELSATIFRVRMCFGRALILLSQPTAIREQQAITILV